MQCTEAEWKILELLWQHGPRSMPEITRALEPETGWTRHTVITLLKRMQAKGTVACDSSGTVKMYTAIADEREARSEQTRNLVDRVFGGKASLLVSTLVEGGELTEEDVRSLFELIHGKKKEDR